MVRSTEDRRALPGLFPSFYSQTMVPSEQVLSYDSGISELPLLGDTIGTNLDRTVARHSERDALVDAASGRRFTYSQLASEVNVIALGLIQLGISKGDRVGIWAPNVPEWVLVQYATAKIGAILVNINPAYRTHELEYVLNQSGIRTLIAVPQFKTSDYAAMISEVRPQCPALRDVILIGHAEWADVARRKSTSAVEKAACSVVGTRESLAP